MKIFWACLLILFVMSCNHEGNEKIADTFELPGIPSDKTLHFAGDRLYYESMDEPGKEVIKCYSLSDKKLLWSLPIGNMSINQGVITSENEYVLPTLSDTVYLVNQQGKARILKLEDRCKINPLVHQNTFILQDRGVGLKCFDARTLQQRWVIRQESSNTMSQPLLLGGNIIYVLDDKTIRSSNATTGALNWETPVDDTLSLHDVYGHHGDYIFILSTNLERRKHISAIDLRNGKLVWRTNNYREINEWERDMYVRKDTLYCRGFATLHMIKLEDGSPAGEYHYPPGITTNIVADRNENLLFGLENNVLVRIPENVSDSSAVHWDNPLNRLYRHGEKVYLYSYPRLYLLSDDVSK